MLESGGSGDQHESVPVLSEKWGLEGGGIFWRSEEIKKKQWKVTFSQKQGRHATGRYTTFFGTQKIRSAFCCTNRAPSCIQTPSNTTPHSPHRCLCYCWSRKTKMNRSRQATSTRSCYKNTVRIQIYLTVKSLDLIPDPRRSHMSQSSQPRAPQLLRVCSRDQGLQVLSTEPMYWNSKW